MTTPTPTVVLPPIALTEPASLDISAYRGDTQGFRVLVTQGGIPLDVSAAEWDCDVRQDADGPVLATMTVTPVVGITNAIDVAMPATATEVSGEAVWDLEMTLGDVVTTILRGNITIVADVSRPTFELPDEPDPPDPPLGRTGRPGLVPLEPGVTPERIGGPDVPQPEGEW